MSLPVPNAPNTEDSRLEVVTTCVGFDDLLDVSLTANHGQVDHYIVVTSHEDRRTQGVAQKHGATCVQTDLFKKNNRNFNKGAAINAGFNRFQYRGWRMHVDADILLPDSFRRVLFNHTHLDRDCLYGADRLTVLAPEGGLDAVRRTNPQLRHSMLLNSWVSAPLDTRFICPLNGYLPLGFFQLWHSSCQFPYPYSLGTAAHDDTMFAAQWPQSQRRHLPTVLCYQVCVTPPVQGENWDGQRAQPRLKP